VPDLFAGRAATVFFRVKNGKSVTVTGKYSDGKPFKQTVQAREIELDAIGHLWARSRVTDLEDRFRLGGDQAAIQKEIVSLAVAHTLLTRFTAFVVVDEKEIVNKDGVVQKVVQPVHTPDQWADQDEEAGMDKCKEMRAGMGAPGNVAYSMAPAPCMPAPKGGMFKRLLGRKSEEAEAPQEIVEKVTASEEKSFRKALEALKKAIAEAKAELAKGKVPSADRIDKARKALQKELAGSALGTRLGALQRFLRSGLLELVAALESKGATAELFGKCDRELEAALQEGTPKAERFWEATV
jgi:Ca-activated chloride channel family protein